MRKFILTIYFKLYAFAKLCSNDNLYQYTAMYLFALLLFFNLLTLIVIVNCEAGISLSKYPSKLVSLLLAFSIAGILYFFFVAKQKYQILLEEFRQYEALHGTVGTFITITYVLFSLLAVIGTIWIKCK